MIDKELNRYEQYCGYNLQKWNKGVNFDNFNYISDHVTSVQFMDNIGNVNHAVIISRYCIYDYIYVYIIILYI